MGVAFLQTYYLVDQGKPTEHYTSRAAWVFTLADGLAAFTYGFLGFWLCERKRRFWRIYLHRTHCDRTD